MSKIFFTDPLIFRGPVTPEPDPTPVVPASAHGGQDPITNPIPCNYQYWLSNYGTDLVSPTGIDIDDYNAWWASMMQQYPSVFTTALYQQLNGTPYPTQNP